MNTSKTKILRLSAVLACGLILLLSASRVAVGQEATTGARPIDVVVVLDDSGSMATCWPWADLPRSDTCRDFQNPPSDPHNLRYSAARLLTQLAGDGDRVAVIRFNAETQDLIGQLQPAGNRGARQPLVESIKPLSDYERTGGYTRIDLGLRRALQILKAAQGEPRPSYVILLTDGVPTQPDGVPAQDQVIKQTVAELERLGSQVFPVFLCNDKAGCPDDAFVQRTMGMVPDRATTADDLLRVFSAAFAKMKPDLHVLDRRNADGDLDFAIREAHGAQQLIIVAENGGLIALKRDGNPVTISSAYQDPNILMNVVDADKLAAGVWTVVTKGRGSFVVAQTATVPELVYPPSSVPGSVAAPHYVPAGKPVLVMARIAGPGSGEPLRLNETTLMQPLSPADPVRWALLPGNPGDLTLQVGDDTRPLQIRRSFRVEARADLPTALALSPTSAAPCLPEASCILKAGFGPGAEVDDVQAMVYATDNTQDVRLVYSSPMICAGRECTDQAEAFKREDGHTYTIRFLLQGRSNGVRFGDWADTTLAMEPSVYLRGLPATLNLKAQPEGGWPVTVVAGTTEDLGHLRATIALTRTNDNTAVLDAQIDFAAAVSGAGQTQATLKVGLPPALRPGRYEGRISFTTDKSSAGRKVRLPAAIPVSLSLARPAAQLSQSAIDFGTVLFDTSPNFRVSETAFVPVEFEESPFNLTLTQFNSSCAGLEMMAATPQVDGQAYRLPLTLRSAGPVAPHNCSGTVVLHGPSDDYDVSPETPLSWRLVIPAVEWKILGVQRGSTTAANVDLGSLGRVGERSGASLLVRYTGQPPFSLEAADLSGAADRGGAAIGNDDLELAAAPATKQAGQDTVYLVPMDVLARRSLSHASVLARWLSGTDYSGRLGIRVAGLPDSAPQEISFRLHNPSFYQRYVQPLYRLPVPGIVTIPLSVMIPLLLLVIVWKRKKDADVERIMHRGGSEPSPVEAELPLGPPRPVSAIQAAGPRRWAGGDLGVNPKDGALPGGRSIPKRPARLAEAVTAAGTSAEARRTASAGPARSVASGVPPARRRAGAAKPRSPQ